MQQERRSVVGRIVHAMQASIWLREAAFAPSTVRPSPCQNGSHPVLAETGTRKLSTRAIRFALMRSGPLLSLFITKGYKMKSKLLVALFSTLAFAAGQTLAAEKPETAGTPKADAAKPAKTHKTTHKNAKTHKPAEKKPEAAKAGAMKATAEKHS